MTRRERDGLLWIILAAAGFALDRPPASTYIVLLFSYPAMVALLSRLLGDVPLLNAAIVAIYYLRPRRALEGEVNVSRASAVMMLGATVIVLILIPFRGLHFPQNPLTLLLLIGIGIFGTVLPVFGVNLAVPGIGAAQASPVSTVEPIMLMVVSMLILGQAIFASQWLGAALIVGSVIALQLRPRNRIDLSINHGVG
jgi:drug/metabolite transporter (DMT)-like permease